MKNTLIVNLYAGPGSGKSTAAAYIFSQLKMKGVNVEFVTEYAKDKTWEGCDSALRCEFYTSAKQSYRIYRVYGKVDVIITDSPILLGTAYTNEQHIKNACYYEDKKYKNRLDYFLSRSNKYPYQTEGRGQTEEEAKEIDERLLNMLKEYNIPYTKMESSVENYEVIINEILHTLKEQKIR